METIIGVDNGYGLTKTENTSFTTSLKSFGEQKPSLMSRVIEYKGVFYSVGGERLKARPDKTENINTYILTLAAIAEELKLKDETEATITLSVGLPLKACSGTRKNEFAEYFKKGEATEVEGKTCYKESFSYEDKSYEIIIKDVFVYPQGYTAILEEIKTMPPHVVLVDIGSWTIDVLPIDNRIPDINKSYTLNEGVINCMNEVNEEIRTRYMTDVLESQIQEIMMGGENVLPDKYERIAKEIIKKYAKNIADILEEYKFNTELLSFVFVGGGANIIKNYGMEYFPQCKVIPDIHGNAKGYVIATKGRK